MRKWTKADKSLPPIGQPVIAVVNDLGGLHDMMRVEYEDTWMWGRNSAIWQMLDAKYGEYEIDDDYLVLHWMLPPDIPKDEP